MTTKTTADRLEAIERMRQHIIATADEQIADYTEKANEDFCNFFHWYAAGMYQAQMKRKYFAEMPSFTKYDDPEALKKALDKRIKSIENDLINRSAFGSCTNEIVNLEHRLILDGKRIIREKLQNMMWGLEELDKNL